MISSNQGSNDAMPLLLPWKLHVVLEEAGRLGQEDIISWLPSGRSFKVHNKKEFARSIMPTYFNTSNYKSFQRSLNLWGFQAHATGGSNAGASHHPLFLRGKPELCHGMKRVRVKKNLKLEESAPQQQSISKKRAPLPSYGYQTRFYDPPRQLRPEPGFQRGLLRSGGVAMPSSLGPIASPLPTNGNLSNRAEAALQLHNVTTELQLARLVQAKSWEASSRPRLHAWQAMTRIVPSLAGVMPRAPATIAGAHSKKVAEVIDPLAVQQLLKANSSALQQQQRLANDEASLLRLLC